MRNRVLKLPVAATVFGALGRRQVRAAVVRRRKMTRNDGFSASSSFPPSPTTTPPTHTHSQPRQPRPAGGGDLLLE